MTLFSESGEHEVIRVHKICNLLWYVTWLPSHFLAHSSTGPREWTCMIVILCSNIKKIRQEQDHSSEEFNYFTGHYTELIIKLILLCDWKYNLYDFSLSRGPMHPFPERFSRLRDRFSGITVLLTNSRSTWPSSASPSQYLGIFC